MRPFSTATFDRNVGGVDQALRLLVGCALVAFAAAGPAAPWGWLGLLPLWTGLRGRCPLYPLFGWSTFRR